MNQRANYQRNGIVINPEVPQPDRLVTITYNGLLQQNGAEHLYAHVGFGNEWSREHDYQMTRQSNGFQVDIPVQHANTLNLAFKDCANNWDNNSGHNYIFNVASR